MSAREEPVQEPRLEPGPDGNPGTSGSSAAGPAASGPAAPGPEAQNPSGKAKAPRGRGTQTSSFGTSKRIAHDASQYYRSRLYAHVDENAADVGPDQALPEAATDRIFAHSSEAMAELPDNCVQLMVTSPPYNVTKSYDDDLSLAEYLALLHRVFAETYRVLCGGGRACINVANLGRKPYIPLTDHISHMMQELGFLMRGEIIWAKGAGAGVSMAWGSWQSAANPVLRDTHEYILVFSKGSFRRKGQGRTSTISRDQFMDWTKSVWTMNPESARRVKHPAPFPVELPYRLIQLYTFAGDAVLDPFMGSGTTAVAASQSGRHYVGYDTSPEFVALAEARIAKAAGPAAGPPAAG